MPTVFINFFSSSSFFHQSIYTLSHLFRWVDLLNWMGLKHPEPTNWAKKMKFPKCGHSAWFFFKFSLLLFLFFGIFHFILLVFFFHFGFHGFNNILYTLQHLMTQKYCVTLPQIDLFFWFYNFNFSIMPSNGRDTGFLFFVYDQIVQLFQLLPNILWFFVFLSYIIVFITCKLVLNGF